MYFVFCPQPLSFGLILLSSGPCPILRLSLMLPVVCMSNRALRGQSLLMCSIHPHVKQACAPTPPPPGHSLFQCPSFQHLKHAPTCGYHTAILTAQGGLQTGSPAEVSRPTRPLSVPRTSLATEAPRATNSHIYRPPHSAVYQPPNHHPLRCLCRHQLNLNIYTVSRPANHHRLSRTQHYTRVTTH